MTPFAFDNLTGNPGFVYGAPVLPVIASSSVKPSTEAVASLRVTVPAGAELWFDGTKTKQVGAVRDFQTPLLPTNRNFTYQLRIRWQEDGQMREQKRTVHVEGGQHVAVDFTSAAAAE